MEEGKKGETVNETPGKPPRPIIEIAGLVTLGIYVLFLIFVAIDDYVKLEILADYF